MNDARTTERLAELATQVEGLARVTRGLAAEAGRTGDPKLETARHLYAVSKARERAFADDSAMFSDPSWFMLLDLYIASAEARSVSVSSATLAAQAPATTALRHLLQLEQAGLIERVPDTADRRRHFVRISDRGIATMNVCLKRLAR